MLNHDEYLPHIKIETKKNFSWQKRQRKRRKSKFSVIDKFPFKRSLSWVLLAEIRTIDGLNYLKDVAMTRDHSKTTDYSLPVPVAIKNSPSQTTSPPT